VREDARRPGVPPIVWSYPRGTAIDAKGGKDSCYAVDYAARTASELSADMVKVNFPHPEKRADVPEAYRAEFSSHQAIDAVVRSANRTLLLVSGGERAGDEAMLDKARESMGGGRDRPDLRPQRLAAAASGVAAVRRRAEREPDQVPLGLRSGGSAGPS
jgi:fructose-bisphosphate aldolase, class I